MLSNTARRIHVGRFVNVGGIRSVIRQKRVMFRSHTVLVSFKDPLFTF
jgi:hypothetical protein